MKSKKIGMLLGLLLGGFLSAQAQVFQWAAVVPSHTMTSTETATDTLGNFYQGSYFLDTLKLNGSVMIAPGKNLAVVKYNSSGNLIWSKVSSRTEYVEMTRIKADALGNTFLGTNFWGSVTLDGTTYTNPGYFEEDVLLVKYDAAGNILWSLHGSGNHRNVLHDMEVDAAGNSYLIVDGWANNAPFSIAGQVFLTDEPLVIKINADGSFGWARSFERCYAYDLTVDGAGNVIVVANVFWSPWNPTLDFGNGHTLSISGNADMAIAKYSPAGVCQWVKPVMCPTQNCPVFEIESNATGELAFTGYVAGSVSVGNVSLTNPQPNYISYIFKLTANGDPEWGLVENSPGVEITELAMSGNGSVFASGIYNNTYNFSDSAMIYTLGNGYYEGFISSYTSAGARKWILPILGTHGELVKELNTNYRGYLFASGRFVASQAGPFPTPVSCILGTHLLESSDQWNSFFTKIIQPANRITGVVFADLNSSGIREAGEQKIPHFPLQLQPGLVNPGTGLSGAFSVLTDTGTYQLFVPNVPPYFQVVPGVHQASFAALGLADSANHFALQPLAAIPDLQLTVIEQTPPRPGFAYRCRLVYRNVGSTVMNGQVTLMQPPALTFETATPAFTSTYPDSVVWAFSDLQPFETRFIDAGFTVDTAAVLGDSLTYSATVYPVINDNTPFNNVYAVKSIITGSYDPNDKLVSLSEISPAQVAAQQPLTYTIRFQNTGTDTAFTVYIRDELTQMLDVNTLEILSASHPFTWSAVGGNKLEWRFTNILLPDSGTNGAASHGYVQYRIGPKTNLVSGQRIRTHANIFFDFNAPITTNQTDTKIALPNGLSASAQQSSFLVFPNPTTGKFTIETELQAGQVTVRVLNLLGQQVKTISQYVPGGALHLEIDTAELPGGIYLVALELAGRQLMQRVAVQK